MIKNPPKDLQIEAERLTGFFRGVVEDNVDPLKAGRVRVRIHGIHTPYILKSATEGIPVNELPWAEPCMPIAEGAVTGFGVWGIPLQGSQVMLFFENSNPTQPRYFASMAGIPEGIDQYSNNNKAVGKNDGFKDPNGQYPLSHRLGEPDVHRLARGVTQGTIVEVKEVSRIRDIPTADGGKWSEPSSRYEAKYPHNTVFVNHGGITIELDATPDKERIHIYHPSVTFLEIDVDGNVIVKAEGTVFELNKKHKNIYIREDENKTIEGQRTNRIEGDDIKMVGKGRQDIIVKDIVQECTNKKISQTANKEETTGGDWKIKVEGNAEIQHLQRHQLLNQQEIWN